MTVYLHNADKAITITQTHRQKMALTCDPNQLLSNAKFMINVNNGKYSVKGYIARIVLDPGITKESFEPHIRNRNCLGIIIRIVAMIPKAIKIR